MSADQLIAHALDLFAPLGPGVTGLRMFGGLGFKVGGRFFAIGDGDGGLYLKVDDVTRGAFEAAGGRPFTYTTRKGGVMVMAYYTPPDAALEDPEAMLPWARLGLEAADRAAARKVKPARKAKPAAMPKQVAKARPVARSKSKVKSKPAAKRAPAHRGPTRRATKRR